MYYLCYIEPLTLPLLLAPLIFYFVSDCGSRFKKSQKWDECQETRLGRSKYSCISHLLLLPVDHHDAVTFFGPLPQTRPAAFSNEKAYLYNNPKLCCGVRCFLKAYFVCDENVLDVPASSDIFTFPSEVKYLG